MQTSLLVSMSRQHTLVLLLIYMQKMSLHALSELLSVIIEI